MANEYGLNLKVSAPGVQDTTHLFGEYQKSLEKSIREQSSFVKSMDTMSNAFDQAQKSALSFTSFLKTTSLGQITAAAGQFNKQLFELGRQGKATGMGLSEFKRGVDDLNRSTNLSRIEGAAFFKSMQDGVKGIKLTAQEVSNLGKTLTTEYGPALDDVKGAMGDLMSLQHKEINLLKRVEQGFKPGELGAYATALMTVNGATEKEIETLIRVARTHGDRSKALSKEEVELRKMKDSLQSLEKAGQDLMVKFGTPLINMFTGMAKTVEKFASTIAGFTESASFQKLMKVGAVASVGAGGAGLALAALKGVFSGAVGVAALAKGAPAAAAAKGLTDAGGGAGGLGGAGGILSKFTSIPVRIVAIENGIDLGGLGGNSPAAELGKAGAKTAAAKTASMGFLDKLSSGQWGAQGGAGGYGQRLAVGGLKGLGIGALGYAAGGAADAMGHDQVGSGIKLAGKVAGMAQAGAALGSIIPGLGNIFGAVAGAGLGLLTSMDDLDNMFGTTKDSATAAAKALKEQTRAANEQAIAMGVAGGSAQMKKDFGYDDKDLWMRENYAGGVQQSFGGRAFESLNATEKTGAYDLSKMIKTTENVAGVSRTDSPELFKAGAIRQLLAESAAKEQNPKLNEDEINDLVTRTLRGEMTGITKALEDALSDKNSVRAASTAATQIYGKAIGPTDEGVVQQKLDTENETQRVRTAMQLSNQFAQIKNYSDQILQSNNTLAEVMVNIKGSVSGAQAADQRSIEVLDAELVMYQQLVDLKKANLDKGMMLQHAEEKIQQLVSGQKISIEQANQMREKATNTVASHAALEEGLNKILLARVQKSLQLIERESAGTNIAKEKAGLMEDQLALAKEMYMGGAASYESQLKAVQAYREAGKLLEHNLRIAEEQFALNPNSQAHELKVISLRRERVGLSMKELSLTKNLREGYLQSMMAFNNVEGAFSKIILSQEYGVDTMLGELGAEGGVTLGARGAGADDPSVRWGPGGSLKYKSQEEMRDRALRYDPHLFDKEQGHFGGDIASATKGTMAGEFLRSQGEEKTRQGPGVNHNTSPELPFGGAHGPSGDRGEAFAPIVGELKPISDAIQVLNDKMPTHVAEGMKMFNGFKPIVDSIKQGTEQEKNDQKKAVAEDKANTRDVIQKQQNAARVKMDGKDGSKEAEFNSKKEKFKKDNAAWDNVTKQFAKAVNDHAHDNNNNNIGQRVQAAVAQGKATPLMGRKRPQEVEQKEALTIAQLEKMAKKDGVTFGNTLLNEKYDEKVAAKARHDAAVDAGMDPADIQERRAALASVNPEIKAHQIEVQRQKDREADRIRITEKRRAEDSVSDWTQAEISAEYNPEYRKQKDTPEGPYVKDRLTMESYNKTRADREKSQQEWDRQRAAEKAATPMSQIEETFRINDKKRGEGVEGASGDAGAAGLAGSTIDKASAQVPSYLQPADAETKAMAEKAIANQRKQAEDQLKQGQKIEKQQEKTTKTVKETGRAAVSATMGVSDTYREESRNGREKPVITPAMAAGRAGAGVGVGAGAGGGAGLGGAGSGKTGWNPRVFTEKTQMSSLVSSMFGFAAGGVVPGTGPSDRDSIPAMLAPGEFVVNARAARGHAALLNTINNNKFANGGAVIPSPAMARASYGGGGGGGPMINLNVRGDSVNKIMHSVSNRLGKTLDEMMSPGGTSGRGYDLPNAG